MMNENGTQTTELQVYEEWEVEDFVADAEAMGIINAFVYKFKQGGRDVTGLTARAIEEICLLNKPRVSISESQIHDEGDTVLATATAMAKFVVPPTKETRPDGTIIETEGYEEVVTAPGARREPKMIGNRPDPHVEQKALTKACRAARRQLISQAALIQAKEKLLKRQEGGKPVNLPQGVIPPNNANGNQQPPAKAGPKKQNPTYEAMQACFKAFGKQKQKLADLGINPDDFWDALGKVLGVESRDDMTEQQWKDVTRDLQTVDFGKIVRDVLVKCGVNLADLESAPDPNE